MSKGVFFCSYKLKKGVSVPDFLFAAKELNDKYISKQKGYISWQQLELNSDDTWADLLTMESMEDVLNFEENSKNADNPLAQNFYSFINLSSCTVRYYDEGASYGNS